MNDHDYLKQVTSANPAEAKGEPEVKPERSCHRSMRVAELPDPMGGIPGPWGAIGD